MALKTVIVDRHDYFRKTLRQYLNGFDELDIKAEAKNGMEALVIVKKLKPDLILIEAFLPELSGIELARRIKRQLPNTRIILFSMNDLGIIKKAAGDRFGMIVPKDRLFDELPGLLSQIVHSFKRNNH